MRVIDILVFCVWCSLRVNLDMGKMVFSWMIKKDSKIPGTMVRTSTIPEQLGRISYLLTDKTGQTAGSSRSAFLELPTVWPQRGHGAQALK